MKTMTVRFLTLVGSLLAVPLLGAQDKQDEAKAAAMKAALPGLPHKQLARYVGEFTTLTKFKPAPDAPAIESPGAAKLTSSLEGRFLNEENTGSLFGQPHHGLRIIGYNNGTKQYEGTWMYTMSTAMMRLTGSSKDDGKTIDWTANYDDPAGQKQTLYATTTAVDDDHFVVKLFTKADGREATVLETTYTRKK